MGVPGSQISSKLNSPFDVPSPPTTMFARQLFSIICAMQSFLLRVMKGSSIVDSIHRFVGGEFANADILPRDAEGTCVGLDLVNL